MLTFPTDRPEMLRWLAEEDDAALAALYAAADAARTAHVGPAVHLRALVEISSHCIRSCGYCGLRAGNAALPRYRMTAEEIVACADRATRLGYGTIVMQGGEDPGLTCDFVSDVVRQVKARTNLAITLSLGERANAELAAWRAAGADRYLLRFETSDPELYRLIHPSLPGHPSDRIRILHELRTLGYEVGSGVMIGIPGQTLASLADDILLFRALDLDMIGVGPYLPHPATPLGTGQWRRPIAPHEQAPATERMVYKVIALTRLACPAANIPATTALATLNRASGRELGLRRGANVVMPNMTPPKYRALYEIYPDKACVAETGEQCAACMGRRIAAIGRDIGSGPGSRRRVTAAKSVGR